MSCNSTKYFCLAQRAISKKWIGFKTLDAFDFQVYE